MHRRSRSGSDSQHYTLQELLQNGTTTHPGGIARAQSGSTMGTPSRFRAEAEAERQHANAAASTSASASLSRSSKGVSEDDHIVCQSKLYDAYELQDLEQHFDRELSFDPGSKNQSDGVRGQGAHEKPLLSASDRLNDHRSPGDYLREVHTRCPCKFCRSYAARTSSLSSGNSRRHPDVYRMPSLSTVSNIEIEPAEEASISSKRPRAADMSDPAPRPALSMPHGFLYRGASAEPSGLAVQEQEAPAPTPAPAPQARAHRYPKAQRTHRLRRRRSRRFPCVKALYRSLRKKHNKRLIKHEDTSSPSTSMHDSREPWKREFHHHHTVNHYHQVHHHHHHHLGNGAHIEEIDWPSSPARLEELG